MTARQDTQDLQARILARCNLVLDFSATQVLRRASMILHRWAELECGDGNDYMSWAIERDDENPSIVRIVTYPHNGKPHAYRIPDRETGALKRVAAICAANSLYFYHQTDPRGCALYIDSSPLDEQNYPRGVAC